MNAKNAKCRIDITNDFMVAETERPVCDQDATAEALYSPKGEAQWIPVCAEHAREFARVLAFDGGRLSDREFSVDAFDLARELGVDIDDLHELDVDGDMIAYGMTTTLDAELFRAHITETRTLTSPDREEAE